MVDQVSSTLSRVTSTGVATCNIYSQKPKRIYEKHVNLFSDVPSKYQRTKFEMYASNTAILGRMSLYRRILGVPDSWNKWLYTSTVLYTCRISGHGVVQIIEDNTSIYINDLRGACLCVLCMYNIYNIIIYSAIYRDRSNESELWSIYIWIGIGVSVPNIGPMEIPQANGNSDNYVCIVATYCGFVYNMHIYWYKK